MANKRAVNAISDQKNVKKKRSTFRDTFLYKLKETANDDQKFVNNKTLREALNWEEDRYNRIKEQLRDENLIVVGRGGPGGAVAIANLPGSPQRFYFVLSYR